MSEARDNEQINTAKPEDLSNGLACKLCFHYNNFVTPAVCAREGGCGLMDNDKYYSSKKEDNGSD